MLVAACLWVLLFPMGEHSGLTAGAVLIAVPLVYTALFGASYVTVRALYVLQILSRLTLLCVAGLIALGVAALLAVSGVATGIGMPTSIALVTLSFMAAGSGALVWWRVASKAKPILAPPYEKRPSSRRHRSRRERRSGGESSHTAEPAEVVHHELIVQWDPKARRLLILHPDRSRYPGPLAEVDTGTLDGMSDQEASRFIGECLTRLMPDLRHGHEQASDFERERRDPES